jgi:EF hand
MNKTSTFRLTGLLALATAIAAPAAFAQDSTTTATDQAQAAQSQPATPATPAEPGKKTWADLDVNKDGNLDKTEAAPIPTLQAVFDSADTNADGALTGEEYKTYLAMNGDGKAKPKK